MIEIVNTRIERRGSEFRNFVKYLNATQDIPDRVFLHIINFPCVYNERGEPAFGLFYIESDKKIRIEIANDLEWYGRIYQEKLGKKFCAYMVLSTLAHEVIHYFQHRDGKDIKENWVDNRAHRLLCEYIIDEPKKTVLSVRHIKGICEVKYGQKEEAEMVAIDPVRFLRKKVKLRPLQYW